MRDIEVPEFGPGYLDVEQLRPQLPDIASLWISNFVELFEDGARLSTPRLVAERLSIESDKSFASFESAIDHISGPKLSNDENVVWDQLWFDVLLEYPIQSDRSAFSIRPGLEHLAARVVTVLRFLPPGGAERAYELVGDPGRVPLDPRWGQAAWRFVELGFSHILEGTDHLLFLKSLSFSGVRFRIRCNVVRNRSGWSVNILLVLLVIHAADFRNSGLLPLFSLFVYCETSSAILFSQTKTPNWSIFAVATNFSAVLPRIRRSFLF